MADENEETPATGNEGTPTAEISSRPDYTPIRINQLARAERYEGDDMILLARPRSSTAYTTVRQTLSGLSSQIYADVMAYVAETSGIISSRQQLRDKGDAGDLGTTQLVGAKTIYDIDSDVSAIKDQFVNTTGDQAIGGNKTFYDLVLQSGPVEISSLRQDQFVTYGQVQEYTRLFYPDNAIAYSSGITEYVISSFTNAKGNNPKPMPETFTYTAQRDCELHVVTEAVASSKVQPSSMNVWVKVSDTKKVRVHAFPDNDKEAYVLHYWSHTVRKGTSIIFTHVN